MRFEIVELQRRIKITIVYVTHDQAEAMSDRIVVMSEGRVHQIGAPRTIYHQPADKFVAGFIGLANFLPCTVLENREKSVLVKLATDLPNHVLICPQGPYALDSQPTVLVRPEDVVLGPDQASGIRGTVLRQTFLGDRSDYLIQLGSVEIRAEADAQLNFAPRESVSVELTNPVLLP